MDEIPTIEEMIDCYRALKKKKHNCRCISQESMVEKTKVVSRPKISEIHLEIVDAIKPCSACGERPRLNKVAQRFGISASTVSRIADKYG